MTQAILDSFTDNSFKDGVDPTIGGAEVDANPEVLANILDGTTQTALGQNGAIKVSRGLVGNDEGGDFDSWIEGDTDIHLFYVDASTDRVGISTNTPASTFDVQGTVQVGVDDTGFDVKFFGATTGKFWEWDESADQMNVAGTVAISGGDVTIFDDQNNADTSLSIGTSATEALKIEVLNGAANKTAEEVRFTTSTASGTAEHGKISFYIDDVEIGDIDDGGIDLAAGMAFTVDGAAVGGASLTGSTNNTITTVTGADAIQGEANLTFDGSLLTVTGDANITSELWVNETANANQTIGLTINQGTNDNEILAFKSDDVAHGYTGITETDTFAYFGKRSGDLGGLNIKTVHENSAGIKILSFDARGGVATTTQTSAAGGLVDFYCSQHNGSGTIADLTANGVAYTFACRTGGSDRTLFLIDEDGDFLYDGVDGGAYDSYADAEAVRAFALETAKPSQLVRTKWDDMVRYRKDDLVEMGVLGYCSPEEEAQGHRGLVNGAQLQRLHTGAIWQNHTDLLEIAKVLSPEQKALLPEHLQTKLLEN